MDAISADDAFYLLKKSQDLEFHGYINIFGTVAAVSEIFRVKKDYVVLVNVVGRKGYHVDVMVLQSQISRGRKRHAENTKGQWSQLEDWRDRLEMNKDVLISQLKLSLLFNGTGEEQLVLRASKQSECIASPSGVSFSKLTLEDWFFKYFKKIVSIRRDHSVQRRELHYCVEIVKSCQDAGHGVYELEGNKRLYLTRIPSESRFSNMVPGATVSVHSCHATQVIHGDEVLIGCIHSSVHLVQSPEHSSTCLPYKHSSSSIASLLNHYVISNTQLVELIQLEKSLMERFQLQNNRNLAGTILHTVFAKPSTKTGKTFLPSIKSRNIIKEFLDQKCCDIEDASLPCLFPTVSEFCSIPHQRCSSSVETDSWSARLWKSADCTPTKVLLGVLHLNKTTGHVELKDITGMIDNVICDKVRAKEQHLCSDRGQGPSCYSNEAQCQCPNIQTWLIGHIVRVDHYQIVHENFKKNSQFEYSRIYVQFSMKDVVLCDIVPEKLISNSGDSRMDRKRLKKCEPSEDIKSQPACQILGDKSRTESSPRVQTNVPRVVDSSQTLVDSIGPKDAHKNNESSTSKCHEPGSNNSEKGSSGDKLDILKDFKLGKDCEIVFVTLKESLQTKFQHSRASGLNFGIKGLRLTELARKHQSVSETNVSHESDKTDSSLSSILVDVPHGATKRYSLERIALDFQGENVKFYEVLYSDCFYRFESRSSPVFVSTMPKGVKVKNLLKSFMLGENVSAYRVHDKQELGTLKPLVDDAGLGRDGVLTVRKFLATRPISSHSRQPGQTLVSVCGMIESRILQINRGRSQGITEKTLKSLGLLPPGYKLTLTLVDQATPDKVQLELLVGLQPYILGLLPGAHIVVENVARRRAGMVNYLQFFPISSIRVVKHVEQIVQQSHSLYVIPEATIFSQWNVDELVETQFQTTVMVCVLLKLHLDPVCIHCASKFLQGKCMGRDCTSTAGHLKIEAIFIGDDSTAKSLFFIKDDAIQGLLGLTKAIWQDLEEALVNTEGFYFDRGQQFSASTPVHQLLYELCSDGHIYRPVKMCLKPAIGLMSKRDQQTIKGLKQLRKKDIPLKFIKYGPKGFETRQVPMMKLDCISIQ